MKLLRLILTLIHLFIIVLLLGTLLNSYVQPKFFPWLNMLSLLFPVLMIVNIVLCFFWIVLWKKRVFLFLILSIPLIIPTTRWINFKGKPSERPNLKVVTLNLKGGIFGKDKIYEYLKNTDADIILGQEYGSELNIPGYENRTKDYEIVALNSKTRIISQGKLAATGNGNAFYADIEFKGKILRIVNVYLTPFSFDKGKVKPTQDFDQNQMKLKYILKKLVPTFKIHQQEIAEIRTAIDQSPYPVILAGDFNAVPTSYEYYHLGKNLKDVFVETGNGSSTSFHDYKFPIRIDYVFCSENIRPISYKVDRSVKLSDHFPVITEFKID
ncbi:MAG: endonuclease/exonuclease/phosphatase family protein [Weeksellaceae bacterium]|nr:endonuclease/exonuclease/phosphatase family protein [Bacteroidota bacterium]MCG2779879.1 endonuclease/exonuclease/phosphatase family protein [Weeksellaceae bacterium]